MRLLKSITTTISIFASSSLIAGADYSVSIYDHSESKPRSYNDAPSKGMQDNRRVDVSIENIIDQNSTKKRKTRAFLKGGGKIWVTSDALVSKSMLEVKAPTIYVDKSKKIKKPLKFYTYNNYSDFIDRYEIHVYKEASNNSLIPIKTIKGINLDSEITWDIAKDKEIAILPNDKILYSLKVFDKDGHFDQTSLKELVIKEDVKDKPFIDTEGEIFGKSSLSIRSIPVHGSRVRVYGSGIASSSLLKIDDQEVRVDSSGKFVYEKIKSAGMYDIPVSIMSESGDVYDTNLALDVKENHIFLVGISDFTIGKYDISGNIEQLQDDEHFNEDIFVDGRLAFYLKGKIKGKYLITAQLDTGEGKAEDMFKDIHKKDPRTMFRHLDPDQYYYVYGDDSTSYKDTDSQGKFYIRAQWDKSKALWGNFNTGITGNKLANINRSLYGAKLQHSSMDVTKDGENKTDLIVFASEAQTSYAHNEFEATGGSLYYLSHKEIVQGSAKVWVEVQERNSQRVAQKKVLLEGKDYDIDELQGRIILTSPLSPYEKVSGPSIIKDSPIDGNKVVLKVDYEYVPDNFNTNNATYGARAKQWINDYLAFGATYGHEGREDGDYELSGVDATLKVGKKSNIKVEVATSKALQSDGENFRSFDGGLHFSSIENDTNKTEGSAFSIEANLALSDFKKSDTDTFATLWYTKREEGFSNARLGDSNRVVDYGLEATSYLNEYIKLTSRITSLQKAQDKENSMSLEGDYTKDDFIYGVEIKYLEQKNGSKTIGEGTLFGLKGQYHVNKYYDLYLLAQSTLATKGSYQDNSLLTLGTDIRYKDFILNAEVSGGDRGESATLGANYKVNENYSLYTNYILSTDSTNVDENVFTVGERRKVNDSLNIFTEHQFSHSDKMVGVGHTFGIDYAFSRKLHSSVTYSQVRYDDATNRDRDSISTSLIYNDKKFMASTKLEYRKDKGERLEEIQYLTTNRLTYRVNPAWSLLAKLNYSKTTDEIDDKDIATFTEAGIGAAYRSIIGNDINFITKYTYLYDLPSLGQLEAKTDERSHVLSAEGSYQLSTLWTLGGKVAIKRKEIRIDRGDGDWLKSEIKLGALRLGYHIKRDWEAMLEAHIMDEKDSGNKKGYLIGVYKEVGEFIKLGIGYNFSDFDDDLHDRDDYSVRGWFINLIGKF